MAQGVRNPETENKESVPTAVQPVPRVIAILTFNVLVGQVSTQH